MFYTSWGKVAIEERIALELHAQCSIAFDTSCLKVVVIWVTIFGLFGSFSLGNFLLGFWLNYFKAQVF
jgi:hypothetical protein